MIDPHGKIEHKKVKTEHKYFEIYRPFIILFIYY